MGPLRGVEGWVEGGLGGGAGLGIGLTDLVCSPVDLALLLCLTKALSLLVMKLVIYTLDQTISTISALVPDSHTLCWG